LDFHIEHIKNETYNKGMNYYANNKIVKERKIMKKSDFRHE
jgi:hypothetical protein